MTKVVALAKGFYLQVRQKGDVFDVPAARFTAEVIEKGSWIAPVGTPLPPERVTPTNRNASMADVIKGLPAGEDEPSPDTMSGMTEQAFAHQEAHPRAHGLDPEEVAKRPLRKSIHKRKTRSDKGKARGPRPVKQKTEEVAS